MLERREVRRNCFQQTLLGLEYTVAPGEAADVYSRACVEAFASVDWSGWGYPFTQVFEPGVLFEVALLEGVAYEDLAELSYRSSRSARSNRDMLTSVEARLIKPAEASYAAWSTRSPMRSAAATGAVPRARILDACTQAVVWYLKRREVGKDDFLWWAAVGQTLARRHHAMPASAISSWYRGLAMVPAAKGMPDMTRGDMRSAREAAEAAERAVEQHAGPAELNLVKTYLESSLKEHMYITRDFDAAVSAVEN
jgi:hypothetical protein